MRVSLGSSGFACPWPTNMAQTLCFAVATLSWCTLKYTELIVFVTSHWNKANIELLYWVFFSKCLLSEPNIGHVALINGFITEINWIISSSVISYNIFSNRHLSLFINWLFRLSSTEDIIFYFLVVSPTYGIKNLVASLVFTVAKSRTHKTQLKVKLLSRGIPWSVISPTHEQVVNENDK